MANQESGLMAQMCLVFIWEYYLSFLHATCPSLTALQSSNCRTGFLLSLDLHRIKGEKPSSLFHTDTIVTRWLLPATAFSSEPLSALALKKPSFCVLFHESSFISSHLNFHGFSFMRAYISPAIS